MTLLHRLASVARWLVRRKRAEQDLDDELRAFVEMAAADRIRDGAAPAEARRSALLQLRGLEQTKERVRSGRHGAWLDEIARDVRYAVRMATRNPGFTVVVVLTLALGIGANTAMFSLIDALMLRLLPVHDPQQLVLVEMGEAGRPTPSFSYPIVRALADRDDILATAAGFSSWPFVVGPPGSVARVPGAFVTGGFYETLGLRSAAGRLLTRRDDEPGAPLVAVISHGYWGRQFTNRLDVIGQTVTIGGMPVTIVGVSPRGFVGANVGQIADITLPVSALPAVNPEAAPLLERGNFWLRVLARPAAGLSVREATARLNAVWPQMSDPLIAPHWPPGRRKAMAESVFRLSPGGTGWTVLRDQYTRPLLVLMGAVAVVLIIACANVASLLLARATVRQREMALRLAIGATRPRVVRQLLLESTLLSMTGAAVGLALAWLVGGFLIRLLSTGPFDVVLDLTPNASVLGFTAAAAVATGIAFGIAPALQASAAAPSAVLKADPGTFATTSWLLPSLVTTQVALSIVLLVGAGLFVRTLQNLRSADLGFASQGVLLVDLDTQRTLVPASLLDEIRRTPGVVSASISTHTPLSGSIWSEPAVPVGQPLPERDTAFFVGAGREYFDVMRIRLLGGRAFTDRDVRDAPAVAIVNDVYARRFFPNQQPVGQRLSATVRGEPRELEIVGVVGNTRAADLRRPPPPTVYVAYAQLTGNLPSTLTIKIAGPPGRAGVAIQEALQRSMPKALLEIRAFTEQVEGQMVQERMLAALASGFGLLALLLACVGLYGIQAYGVARRTKELGIRIAFGARRRSVIALVLRGAARLVLIGIALGVPAALAASRWFESLLFGLTPTDLTAVGGGIAVLIVTAQIAAFVPAWRASRVNPLVALRHD